MADPHKDFHAQQDWYFRRDEIGSVVIRHGNGPDCDEVVLDVRTWASVVAHVSLEGDSSDTFNAAFRFHTAGAVREETKR
ncbi:MAG: hypothetical protein JWM85_330 [Acidimicrobiaceae bacterium]|nr:hypothetical protein [Acidimicrobiaceae bacterium]